MNTAEPPPLLAPFEGREPPRPAWFAQALAHAPERRRHTVQGAAIETLCWGDAGRPGLLLLHGKMAHADWWSFIAPFFAATHRVVAISFAGMGGSDWRASYDIDTMADEALAVAQAEALFDAPLKPLVVGHSFGGFASLACIAKAGARLGGVVLLDMPLLSRVQRRLRDEPALRVGAFASRPTRVYTTPAAALARFRFAPPQPCDNLFIADHIARTSIKPVTLPDGAGWTWRFDPRVAAIHPGDAAARLQAANSPVALAWGEDSALVTPDVAAYGASLCPPATPTLAIPGARHHVMVDQPLALVAALRALLSAWPA